MIFENSFWIVWKSGSVKIYLKIQEKNLIFRSSLPIDENKDGKKISGDSKRRKTNDEEEISTAVEPEQGIFYLNNDHKDIDLSVDSRAVWKTIVYNRKTKYSEKTSNFSNKQKMKNF